MKLTTESTVVNDGKINTDIGNAQTTADDAKTIATDTAQYFWFTSSGTDTGAHISEQTRADFEANPSGGNLLANSNGIAVRDGMTELAIFSDTIRLGASSGQRATISSTALEMYDENNQRRIRVNSGGVIVGRPDKGRAVITDQGMTIYDVNNDDVAFYGSGARIGKSGDYHVNIGTSGVSFVKNNDLFGSFESSANIGGLLYLLSATSSSVYLQVRPDRITLYGENDVVAQLTKNSLTFNIGDHVNLIGIRSSDYSIGVEENFYVGGNISADGNISAEEVYTRGGMLTQAGQAKVPDVFYNPPANESYGCIIRLWGDGLPNQSHRADTYWLGVGSSGRLYTGTQINGATAITWREK